MNKLKTNEKIIELLEKELIKPKGGLKSVFEKIELYHKMANESENKEALFQILSPLLLEKSNLVNILQRVNVETMAIDFPIHITDPEKPNRETVMICALDSLPPDSTHKDDHWDKYYPKSLSDDDYLKYHDNYITPWAPFSLIDKWDTEAGSFKQNMLFFSTIFETYDLYVTDIYKLFYRFEKNKRSTNHWDKGALDLFEVILKQEVEIINPKAIITLGNKSRNALLRFVGDSPKKWEKEPRTYKWIDNTTQIISIPHISGAANGAKSLILNNPEYKNITETGNVKLAKIVLENIKKSK